MVGKQAAMFPKRDSTYTSGGGGRCVWLATTIVLASYVPFANVCDKLLEVWQMHRARGLIWDKLNIRECFLISLYAWPRWIPPTWIDLHLPKLGSDLDLPKLPKFQSESGTSRGQNYLESGEY